MTKCSAHSSGDHVWARRRDGRECAYCGEREYGDFESQRAPADAASMLTFLQNAAFERGYTFEQDPDGTQRMIRPDGSVAIIARPKS